MKRLLRSFGAFSLALGMLSVAVPAAAQEPINLRVGYQYLYVSGSDGEDGTSLPLGFDLGIGFPLGMRDLSVIGDLNWSRRSEEEFGFEVTYSALAFGGGLEWARRNNPSFTPFVNLILGLQRDSSSIEFLDESDSVSETNFILQPGVGVAFPIGGMQAFVNGNYRRVFYEEGLNFFTFVAGLQFGIMR